MEGVINNGNVRDTGNGYKYDEAGQNKTAIDISAIHKLREVCREYGGEGWKKWFREELHDAQEFSCNTGKLLANVLRNRIRSIRENQGKVY